LRLHRKSSDFAKRPPSEDAEAGQDAPYLVTQPRRATQGRKSS